MVSDIVKIFVQRVPNIVNDTYCTEPVRNFTTVHFRLSKGQVQSEAIHPRPEILEVAVPAVPDELAIL